ncbi:riboflavin kinase/FMN adenylyltransferase [Collimonas sp. OK607]|uniref:riboflavin kinase n=1 Tax=Collimonas sp. OK607 TaxID=1798194 RepID=UPI0008E2C5A2|nr:riboflavin kinase [Collimonas sp. OK607]SFB35478.1 riboflavin kinase/FMN adenylyltransferase [Collimonas sp. OK607]
MKNNQYPRESFLHSLPNFLCGYVNYLTLEAAGATRNFETTYMKNSDANDVLISSHAVRNALILGDMKTVTELLGRPYSISGRVMHGAKLGRQLGFRTLNVRIPLSKAYMKGIFVVQVHGLDEPPLNGVASLGTRPTVDDSDRMLLEAHCFEWPTHLGTEGAYGKQIEVDLLHKLRDEVRFDSLEILTAAIRQDVLNAKNFLTTYATLHR